MAALVQTIPPQTGSINMLQTRPSSSSSALSNQQRQQMSRNGQSARAALASNLSGHRRGSSSSIQPYAFTSTPGLNQAENSLRQNAASSHLRLENKTILQVSDSDSSNSRSRYTPSNSSSISSFSAGSNLQSKDDFSIPRDTPFRPLDNIVIPTFDASSLSLSGSRPSPDRYRKSHRRADTTGSIHPSAMPSAANHAYDQSSPSNGSPTIESYRRPPITSMDDMPLYRHPSEQAMRYRRRSLGNFGGSDAYVIPVSDFRQGNNTTTNAKEAKEKDSIQRPNPNSHGREGSSESTSSTHSSRQTSAKRDSSAVTSAAASTPDSKNPASSPSETLKRARISSSLSQSTPSTETAKSKIEPSPQQEPQEQHLESKVKHTNESRTMADSPAVQTLSAVSKKDEKKKSRLRRAFSFGSASELRRASAHNNHEHHLAEKGKMKKDKHRLADNEEEDPEQAAIARRQEAAGLGESIYSGQGNFFIGSTDNISVSSTASSASIMLRKMGKGMKKGTRSLVGLFRPKSVIGVPAADKAVPQSSLAQVSVVNVEAERDKANAYPLSQTGGGTGFPKFERNSLDAGRNAIHDTPSMSSSTSGSDNIRHRKSIIGGDDDRAQVLAAVRKGILKRPATTDRERSGIDSGNASPVSRSMDTRSQELNLPNIPYVNDTPNSSAPSTPSDDKPPRSSHRRTDSVRIEDDDYFLSVSRLANDDARSSSPGTPHSGSARNISFSPRIQFHDTWPQSEYDRRGEIATCNRLTPLLAQQIKEELNTFKMEMEVHESSKVYTHFFE